MTLQLPDIIVSQQDFKSLKLEIQKYAEWFAQTAVKMRVTKQAADGSLMISPTALAMIESWFANQAVSSKGLDQLLAAMADFEASVPHITITLAAPPPNTLKRTLAKWCRENVDPNILVNFKFNATILGGMVVSYGSHVFDWSFKQQILTAREKFPEILRHV